MIEAEEMLKYIVLFVVAIVMTTTTASAGNCDRSNYEDNAGEGRVSGESDSQIRLRYDGVVSGNIWDGNAKIKIRSNVVALNKSFSVHGDNEYFIDVEDDNVCESHEVRVKCYTREGGKYLTCNVSIF
jgi:hypothetical protein